MLLHQLRADSLDTNTVTAASSWSILKARRATLNCLYEAAVLKTSVSAA